MSKTSLEAAAEAAARVNALLIAKGKLKPPKGGTAKGKNNRPDDLHTAEVDINDAPLAARNMLTRGHTQDEIHKFSGAAISTRGRFMTEEEKTINSSDRPLYLHIQAPEKKSVDLAVHRIYEVINNYTYAKSNKHKGNKYLMTSNLCEKPAPLMSINTDRSLLLEKVFIGLEHAIEGFDVSKHIRGENDDNLNYICSETGVNVYLRGMGSGYLDPSLMRENDSLHLVLEHHDPEALQAAKDLAFNLVQTVHTEYLEWQQQHPTHLGQLIVQPQVATLNIGSVTLAHPASLVQQTGGIPGSIVATPGLSTSASNMPGMYATNQQGRLQSGNYHLMYQLQTSVPTLVHQPVVSVDQPQNATFALQQGQTYTINSPQTQIHAYSNMNVTAGRPPNQTVFIPQQTLHQVVPPSTHVTPLLTHPVSVSFSQSTPVHITTNQSLLSQQVHQNGVHINSNQGSLSYPGYGSSQLVSVPPPQRSISDDDNKIINGVLLGSIPQKRKFTEEKVQDDSPKDLLGYQHGPPHLANLVHSSNRSKEVTSNGYNHVTGHGSLSGLPQASLSGLPQASMPGMSQYNVPISHYEHPPICDPDVRNCVIEQVKSQINSGNSHLLQSPNGTSARPNYQSNYNSPAYTEVQYSSTMVRQMFQIPSQDYAGYYPATQAPLDRRLGLPGPEYGSLQPVYTPGVPTRGEDKGLMPPPVSGWSAGLQQFIITICNSLHTCLLSFSFRIQQIAQNLFFSYYLASVTHCPFDATFVLILVNC